MSLQSALEWESRLCPSPCMDLHCEHTQNAPALCGPGSPLLSKEHPPSQGSVWDLSWYHRLSNGHQRSDLSDNSQFFLNLSFSGVLKPAFIFFQTILYTVVPFSCVSFYPLAWQEGYVGELYLAQSTLVYWTKQPREAINRHLKRFLEFSKDNILVRG